MLLKHEIGRNLSKGARRGQLDVMGEILLFCREQKTQTSIMYNANLNYSQLKKMMTPLTRQGFLDKRNDKYIITKKGYQFLEVYAQIQDLLEDFSK
jgi:predicted transcriptional regulator